MTLPDHAGEALAVTFSPDGKRLAAACGVSTKVWDAENGKELLTLHIHSGPFDGVAFSPDGRRLATANGTVQIYAFDLRDLLELARSRTTRIFAPEECERYFQSVVCPRLDVSGPLRPN